MPSVASLVLASSPAVTLAAVAALTRAADLEAARRIAVQRAMAAQLIARENPPRRFSHRETRR